MTKEQTTNPFFLPYDTPHGTVPFDKIGTCHFEPAIRKGIEQHDNEIKAITDNPEQPTFHNTVEAYEKSGRLLEHVVTVFENLLSANTNDEMQELANKLMPVLSNHYNDVSLNEELFARIKTVYNNRTNETLDTEQNKLLDDTYKGFARGGANLPDADKKTLRELSESLSLLSLQFSNNLLKDTNTYKLNLTDKAQISGLPDGIVEAAAEAAAEDGQGGWTFTLNAPSYVPFMTYADDRELRRTLYMAYNTRCTHGDTQDNTDTVRQIVNRRMQVAQLLGYRTYADYALENRMAHDSRNVYRLLDELLDAYMPTAQDEVNEVQALAREMEGDGFTLMPWDWSYYSHKLKERKFNIDNEKLRPYFELGNVIGGVFGLATRLYGITFKENKDIPVYHPDVRAYDVTDKDGTFLAVLYADFHPRAGKQSGAWMTSYKGQWKDTSTGENSRPQVSLVMNFTKPTKDKPALLTFDEVTTFLHEFGHSLHGMFADTHYGSLSGTNVYWDFVELPSQFMENFATEKEFLHTVARHYKTGELIPDCMVQALKDSENFNVAYACMRQVGFGLLDMAWYTRKEPFDGDVMAYEQEAWKRTQLLPRVGGTCMSTQFSHIFAGGYAAGYYSYKWAEVLDADAFALFKQRGLFNAEVASSFRENILSRGGTEDPMTLYKRFRGQEPTIDALLERNGLKK